MPEPQPAVAVFHRRYLGMSETFIYRQLTGLAQDFDLLVLTPECENLDQFPFESLDVRGSTGIDRSLMRVYRKLFYKAAWLSPGQFWHWRRVLRQRQARLIHAHFGFGGLDMLPLARSLKLPLLVTFHGMDASSVLRDPRYRANLNDLFAYAEVITVSRVMAERLIGLGANPARIRTHYIGVPLDDFQYIERRPPRDKVAQGETVRFLQVSRLTEKKGIAYSLRAFGSFLAHYPNSELVIAGDGPLRTELEALSRALGIASRVQFRGAVPRHQVIDLMISADILLHHSVTAQDGDQEGIPITLMEGMSTGLICLSTYHAGIPELIAHDQSGFLVEERDVEGYVAQMITAVACDDHIGRQAAEKIRQDFDLAAQNRKLAAIYSEIIARQRTP